MEEFFKVNGLVIGQKYPTKSSGELVVKSFYRNPQDMYVYAVVEFVTTRTRKDVRVGNVLRGQVKDDYLPSVYSVGYLGRVVKGENKIEYALWIRMLRRCYDKDYIGYKYYGGCGVTVDKEWHNFSEFLEYYKQHNIEGFTLDKDLLSPEVGKVYSKSTCCFIPRSVNSLLGSTDRGDGVEPNGTGWRYGGGSYPRRRFPTKKQAYKYRSECFQGRLDTFLLEYSSILPERVLTALNTRLQKEIDKTC